MIKGECKILYLSFASVEFKEVRECKVLYIDSKVYETPIHEFRTPYYIKTCSYVLLSLKHVLLS